MLKFLGVVTVILFASYVCLNPSSIEVNAFDLGYHEDKCFFIGNQLGFSEAAIKKIRLGNLGVDVGTVVKFIYREETCELLEKSHFDNLFNYSAIKERWRWLEDHYRQLTTFYDCEEKCDEALLAIGQFLHSIEDFYSHSNWVEFWLGRGVSPLPTWQEVQEAREGPYAEGRKVLEFNGERLQTGAWKMEPDRSKGQKTHDEMDHDNPKLDPKHPNHRHFKDAYDLSVRDSLLWMNKIRGWVGEQAWEYLKSYTLGWLKELWYDAKLALWKLAAKAIGKWKADEPAIISDPGASITMKYSSGSITSGSYLPLPTYEYVVNNTGTTSIYTLNITMKAGSLSYVINLTIPDQWVANYFGDNCIFFNTTAAPIEPGQQKVFQMTTNYSYIQNSSLTVNGNISLEGIAPGPPDDFDKEFIAIIELFNFGGDVDGNGAVNIKDLGFMARSLGTNTVDIHGRDWEQYNVECDFDMDGDVDVFDLAVVAINYGKIFA